MKKLTLIVLFLLSGYVSMAQMEIGLMLSPTVASNRFIADDKYNFRKESTKLRMGVGVVADYFFAKNYALSVGLTYRGKGSEITYSYSRDENGSNVTTSGKDDLAVQYMELPIALKLFTNEITPGSLLYFQVGGSLNTKVAATVNDKKVIDGERVIKRFNIFEAGAILGGGIEIQMGESTKIFSGITYHRGLSDIDDYYMELFSDRNISVKNNSFSFDVGMKF